MKECHGVFQELFDEWMSEWMNTWKQSSWAQSTWRQNHITLSSWVTSCLSLYSKSLSRWEQTIPCHVMHGGNAQINEQCSSALIFKRREPYTSLWDAVLTLTSRTEKSHYLRGWLPEMKWVDFSGTVCSHPGPLGPEGKCAESVITCLRLPYLMRQRKILSQRWASSG